MKRFVAMLLVLLMLTAALCSCQKAEENGEGENLHSDVIPSGTVDQNDTDANEYQNDRLPTGAALESLGFAGSEVRVLSWDKQEHQTFPKGDSANDPIKSKLYYHWKGIEERFGITFKTDYTDSEWSGNPKFLVDARSDASRYDMMQTQTLYPSLLAMEGRLVNLMKLGFPDLEMPWWPTSTEEWSQHGALFYIASNSSAMSISNMYVIFVNAGLITAKGNADPVQSVLRGTWTVEEMTKISKSFAGEAANLPADERIYGFIIDEDSTSAALYYACGFNSVVNVNGVGTMGYDEESELQAISAAIDAFKPLMMGYGTEVKMNSNDDATEMYQGRTAMLLGFMEHIRTLEDTEAYTVVPLPMLNEEQYDTLGYRTVQRDWSDVWCVPTTTQSKQLSGMLLEANASSEYRNVGPYYYEEYLKDRYANGVAGRECFDILRDSLVYDFGRTMQAMNFGAEWYWRTCFRGGLTNSFVAEARGEMTMRKQQLAEVLETYQKYVNN